MSLLFRLKAPVFTAGGAPVIAENDFRLEVAGLTAAPRALTLADLKALPFSAVSARLTSVSGWSVRAIWEGVLWRDFVAAAAPLPEARYATFVSHGGVYETTISLADLDHPRTMIVWGVEGEPLETAYGGPVRMVVPHLYGYKSAKWLARVEFGRGMRGGYWEDRGYTREGIIEPGLTLDVNTGRQREIAGGEITEF